MSRSTILIFAMALLATAVLQQGCNQSSLIAQINTLRLDSVHLKSDMRLLERKIVHLERENE